jgi:hypothetical protein
MADVTLDFLAEQLGRVLGEQRDFREEMRSFREEMADMRDQMTVLTGMVLRLDDSLTALIAQGRLTERRLARLEKRVDALEGAS